MAEAKSPARIFLYPSQKCSGMEISVNNSIVDSINKLKEQRNAVILAHYYVDGEIQKLADYVGDSFYLAKVAAKTDADVIVFCGVSFMGESAKLLNPNKTVLLPDASADCAMAHMCEISFVEEAKKKYDDLAVVCYINSTAALKSVSDVCVTSSNALKIVKSLPQKNILFIPDRNLGHYIASQVPDKNFIYNEGFCPIHNVITGSKIETCKEKHKDAPVLIHPECPEDALKVSDFIGSTSEIINYVATHPAKEYIIATETGVFHKLMEVNPDAAYIPVVDNQICQDMKLLTLDKVYDALLNNTGEVTLNKDFSTRALMPLEKMLELGK